MSAPGWNRLVLGRSPGSADIQSAGCRHRVHPGTGFEPEKVDAAAPLARRGHAFGWACAGEALRANSSKERGLAAPQACIPLE